MSRIVHLSDTHFGTEVAEVVRAVEAAILKLQPDIVLISGDITQRARPQQFQAAADFLAKLPADTKFVIPGNHDIPLFNLPARLVEPYANYSRVFGLREGIWCHDNVGIIGYDATSKWRHTRGSLSDQQLIQHIKQARSQLKPGALLIACAHQPLVTAWPEDVENVLVNNGHIAELFAQYEVDLVLSGHVHVPLIATTSAYFPTLTRSFVLSGAGTATSYRVRPGAPNSFNVIDTAGLGPTATISITLMEYQPQTQAFMPHAPQAFHLTDTGWRA